MKDHFRILLKSLGILLLMAISGVVWFAVSMLVFVQLGIRFHDQYEYYTYHYPALLFVPAVVGFFFPLLILRWLKKIGEQRRRTLFKTALLAAVIVFAVALFFWLLGVSGVI